MSELIQLSYPSYRYVVGIDRIGKYYGVVIYSNWRTLATVWGLWHCQYE